MVINRIGPISCAKIIGTLYAILAAWLYNVVAGLVGGIEMDVQ
jgi:hypothetical protein